MKKVEKDGKIAVLVSDNFGAGWSTGCPNYKETLCMDAEIVQAVIDKNIDKAIIIAREKCGYPSHTKAIKLAVKWVSKGFIFEINEYDGKEYIHVISSLECMIA